MKWHNFNTTYHKKRRSANRSLNVNLKYLFTKYDYLNIKIACKAKTAKQ
jgi:hypothetical protein